MKKLNFFQEDYYGITPNKISEIIHRADVNKDGKIPYRVSRKLCKHKGCSNKRESL